MSIALYLHEGREENMSPPGGNWNYATEDKARLIAMDLLDEYEREKVEPRHKETQSALRRIEKFQWIAYGAFAVILFLVKVVFNK
jgi:deoxyribodipyrimidine photolyase-like uncharacterized protein